MRARQAMKTPRWLAPKLPSSVRMHRGDIPGRTGAIPVKCFEPATRRRAQPLVLFIHGGGWISGGADSLDYLCANVSAGCGTLVVAVEYRLAPEFPFPAALEDCQDALGWLSDQADDGVAIIGDSAGGNIAAALCLLNRDNDRHDIRQQILVYPCLDGLLESRSIVNGTPGFSANDISRMFDLYRGSTARTDPLISPLHGEDLSGLPPALIITADCDPLRDDGPRYASRLQAAGVQARHINYPGMPHGFLTMPKLCRHASLAVLTIVKSLVERSNDPRSESPAARLF